MLPAVVPVINKNVSNHSAPTETLTMLLAQAMSADRSCQNIVNQAAIQRLVGGLSPCSTHTGADCRARQHLSVAMVSSLAQYLGELIDKHTPNQWRWHGRRALQGTPATSLLKESKVEPFLQGIALPLAAVSLAPWWLIPR